jgi:hypothetical protein
VWQIIATQKEELSVTQENHSQRVTKVLRLSPNPNPPLPSHDVRIDAAFFPKQLLWTPSEAASGVLTYAPTWLEPNSQPPAAGAATPN